MNKLENLFKKIVNKNVGQRRIEFDTRRNQNNDGKDTSDVNKQLEKIRKNSKQIEEIGEDYHFCFNLETTVEQAKELAGIENPTRKQLDDFQKINKWVTALREKLDDSNVRQALEYAKKICETGPYIDRLKTLGFSTAYQETSESIFESIGKQLQSALDLEGSRNEKQREAALKPLQSKSFLVEQECDTLVEKVRDKSSELLEQIRNDIPRLKELYQKIQVRTDGLDEDITKASQYNKIVQKKSTSRDDLVYNYGSLEHLAHSIKQSIEDAQKGADERSKRLEN